MRVTTEHTAAGRWGGRLTQRPLPLHDPLLEALSRADRERLARIWIARAAMERRVADSFEVVAAALERLGAASDLVALARRAIDDEYRHTELSRVVASRFAGRELPTPERLVLEVPKHKGAPRALRDTLFVVGQCVLNETTASAFLETCLAHAEGELAKCALRELFSDEIEHGRMGWTHLAAVGDETRAKVSEWILPMAYLNLRQWQIETPYDANHPVALAAHGAPPAGVIHSALVDALRDLIVPGFQSLGMQTGPLEAWLAAGARTDRAPVEFVAARS
jgi:hypothetical protein